MMRLVLNILWFVLGGFVSGTAWVIAGLILCLTIIGIPYAPAAFRIAGFTYWPFGRVVAERDTGAWPVLLNILWLVLAGWWLALQHIMLAVPLAVSIIGIPFAWQHVKLAVLSLTPVGKHVVRV